MGDLILCSVCTCHFQKSLITLEDDKQINPINWFENHCKKKKKAYFKADYFQGHVYKK